MWCVRVSLPTDFPPNEIAPYVADAFGPRKTDWPCHGTVQSAGWRGEVFEQRTQRTTSDGRQTELVLRVTARPNGGSYVRLHESGIPDPERRDETLRELQSDLNRLNQFLIEASRLRKRTRQAIIIVHGIGEQLPGQMLRSFKKSGVFGASSTPGPFVKPDYDSSLFELRTMRIARDTAAHRPTTDVHELYWADLIRDTTLSQVYGWLLRLLLAPNANIASSLRKYFWAVRVLIVILAAAIGWFLFSRTGQAWKAAMTAGALAAIPTVGWLLLRLMGSRFLLSFLGDAARYLEPRPGNVERRQAIREAGVDLLNALHDSGDYSRIIVFGHSLGSVIAYDILSLAWTRRCRKNENKKVMTSRELIRVEDLLNPRSNQLGVPSIDEIRARQYAAWQEYRRNGFQWLVSDFVTAGSPLTSARLLLNLDKWTSFDDLVADRSFPTCPPQTETVRTPTPGRKRQQFTFTHAYPDPDGGSRSRSVQVPHHAALFALIRWTNLYFPLQRVIRGDPIGGPLCQTFGSQTFGSWIDDVAVPQPGGGFAGFAHTLYWRPRGNNAHIQRLHEALALPFHGTLDQLTAELYAQQYAGPVPTPTEAYRHLPTPEI